MKYHKRLIRLRKIQDDEKLTAFIPPDSALDLAHKRIGGMVEYFMDWVEGCSIWNSRSYVERLATSAYLQGVEDCAIAMAKKGYVLAQPSDERGR